MFFQVMKKNPNMPYGVQQFGCLKSPTKKFGLIFCNFFKFA